MTAAPVQTPELPGPPPDPIDSGGDTVAPPPPLAGRAVRFASLVYEGILLVPVLFLAGYLFVALTHDTGSPALVPLLRLWLLIVVGAYFCYCWTRSGQTLALKTWRLRIARADGSRLSLKLALARYVLAVWGLILAGIGFWWAFVDRDGQFLHDRLAGTRIFRTHQARNAGADAGLGTRSGDGPRAQA
jgi:uncharacterized RDD family membrane protein YckC